MCPVQELWTGLLAGIRELKRKGAVWTNRGWGETLEFSFRECSAYVSPQSLLACCVSPHSPYLISGEKRSASGLAQGLSEDFNAALSA